jgi:hypothetical protein
VLEKDLSLLVRVKSKEAKLLKAISLPAKPPSGRGD